MNRQARVVKIEGLGVDHPIHERLHTWNSFGKTGFIEAGRRLVDNMLEARLLAGQGRAAFHIEVRDADDESIPPVVFKYSTKLVVNCLNPRQGC